MVTRATQICLMLSALYSLVYSQPPQPTDPYLGNPFNQPGFPGGVLDPNFPGVPTDPNYPNSGIIGFPGSLPPQPAPLPRPNPMQSMLPLMLLRGGDMAQMMAMMSMFGGGGGMGASPLLWLSLLGGM